MCTWAWFLGKFTVLVLRKKWKGGLHVRWKRGPFFFTGIKVTFCHSSCPPQTQKCWRCNRANRGVERKYLHLFPIFLNNTLFFLKRPFHSDIFFFWSVLISGGKPAQLLGARKKNEFHSDKKWVSPRNSLGFLLLFMLLICFMLGSVKKRQF